MIVFNKLWKSGEIGEKKKLFFFNLIEQIAFTNKHEYD